MASKHQAVRTEPVRAWRGVQAHALDAILRDAVDLAIWERALAAGLSAAIGQADLGGVEFLRFETPADRVAEELCLAFLEAGIEGDGWALAEDAQLLACAFARNLGIDDVAIRLEHVTGDACRRFHADYVSARLITTYSGPGTQWLDAGAAARHEAGIAPPPTEIRQLREGDVGIFKGRRWPGATSIVHRSPPILASGAARLLLVIDPARSQPGQIMGAAR